MDFFDKLGDKIVSASREVSDMAKDVSDSTKLSYDIRKKKQDLDVLYKDLGKKYYESNKDADDSKIVEIRELVATISEMEAQVAGIRGGKPCPKCGAVVPMDSGYCNKCGSKFDDIICEEEDEEKTVDEGESEDSAEAESETTEE